MWGQLKRFLNYFRAYFDRFLLDGEKQAKLVTDSFFQKGVCH